MVKKAQTTEVEVLDFDFDALSSDVFGDDVTTAKLNPDLQGKIFLVYGANNTGKTTQCAKMVKNSFILPFEQGTNALTGTKILKTGSWADAKRHYRKLTTNKQLASALRAGHTIGVIIDGLENMGKMAQDFICDQAGVEKFSKAGAHGSQWSDYESEIHRFVNGLARLGFTLFFIGHPAESKEIEGYLDLASDKRVTKPIKDIADFTFYLQSNGSVNNEVVHSSAYLVEHLPTEESYGFFARCRFPRVQPFFEKWEAQAVRSAIYEGIVKQAEEEGAELVGFEEVVEKYESTFSMTLEEVKNAIFDCLEECDVKGLTEKADDVLLNYLDNVDQVETLKDKQMQTAQTILDELEHLLGVE